MFSQSNPTIRYYLNLPPLYDVNDPIYDYSDNIHTDDFSFLDDDHYSTDPLPIENEPVIWKCLKTDNA